MIVTASSPQPPNFRLCRALCFHLYEGNRTTTDACNYGSNTQPTASSSAPNLASVPPTCFMRSSIRGSEIFNPPVRRSTVFACLLRVMFLPQGCTTLDLFRIPCVGSKRQHQPTLYESKTQIAPGITRCSSSDWIPLIACNSTTSTQAHRHPFASPPPALIRVCSESDGPASHYDHIVCTLFTNFVPALLSSTMTRPCLYEDCAYTYATM